MKLTRQAVSPLASVKKVAPLGRPRIIIYELWMLGKLFE